MLEKPTIDKSQFPIESLLSARLLLEPQIEGDRIYFLSDLAGTLSLYSIARNGSIPQPLLPGGLALVNPHIMPGDNFHVLPRLGKVLVMIDKLGDENYQPNLIPLSGGIPEPLFGDKYRNEQIACVHCDKEKNIGYFFRDNRKTPDIECLRVNLETGEVKSLGTSIYGNACNGVSSDHSTVILADGYTAGDIVLYYWKEGMATRKLLFGVPLDQRDGKQVPLTGIGWCSFVDSNKALFFESTIFHDNGGLTCLSLDDPSKPIDVPIKGLRHSGQGEMTGVRRVNGDVFVLEYNIDGASWAYEGRFHSGTPPTFEVERVLIGSPLLSGGVVLGLEWQIKNEKPLQTEYVFSSSSRDLLSSPVIRSSSKTFSPSNALSGEKVFDEDRITGLLRRSLELDEKTYSVWRGFSFLICHSSPRTTPPDSSGLPMSTRSTSKVGGVPL